MTSQTATKSARSAEATQMVVFTMSGSVAPDAPSAVTRLAIAIVAWVRTSPSPMTSPWSFSGQAPALKITEPGAATAAYA